MVHTPYVAYLDDDDRLKPNHLELLEHELRRTHADLVFPWFDVVGGDDPFPANEGRPFDPDKPVQIPVTFLARTAAVATPVDGSIRNRRRPTRTGTGRVKTGAWNCAS